MPVPGSRARAIHARALATLGLLLTALQAAGAQLPRAPEAGGRTASLGQPPRWRWEVGFAAGEYFESEPNEAMVRTVFSAYRSPPNPVKAITELGFEAYGGARGSQLDAGVRALLQVRYLSGGLGADYNFQDGRVDMLATLHSPVRRGGLFARGTQLRIDWYPLLSHSFTIGVTAPLWDPLAGRSRPIRNYVLVAATDFERPAPHRPSTQVLVAVLDSLRASAEWVRRLVAPFLDHDGRRASVALERSTRYLDELKTHLAARSVDDEMRLFHALLQRAFGLAAGQRSAGEALAQRCRDILLDEVLLPYNALLGRRKRADTVKDLGVAARGRFSRWLASSGLVAADRVEDVLYAFQRVTEILEGVRRTAAEEWDDPRLVWLPLQYALLPEDHDEQRELDALVERATRVSFTDHNRISYVANLAFHLELLRMIHETRDYHVLWIHDFPAVTPDGRLDWASLAQVVDGYLSALAARVESYDSTGTLPSYFIFLDQHYYEERKSRVLMTLLESPLHASSRLPVGTPEDHQRLAAGLARLRTAVRNSRVLQAEARQYGEAWLRNRIKVHVSITNRADASFWSGGLVGNILGYPDDVMRDHRKIAFRDVTEDDPYGGEAIVTGMGVGQQYLGPGWDDRSLMLQGPVLVELTRAARELLLSQGLTDEALPPLLRPRPVSSPSLARVAAPPDAARFTGRAMALVNGTGHLSKPVNVAKAVLYSLQPPGSVLKVPDSLWNASFYSGLLLGAALRGCQVLVIAPAQPNAPSSGFPQMSLTHELFTRLLLARRALGRAMAAAGGDLRTGLYALPADQDGFASRMATWTHQVETTPFLQALLPFASSLVPLVAESGASLPRRDGSAPGPTGPPKLHQKVQFLATRALWRGIATSSEWPQFMATYLRYRTATYAPGRERTDAPALADSLARIAGRLFSHVGDVPGAATFALVGSQNQDYRGMFMDGEVDVLFTGPEALLPLIDLVFMIGTVTWVDDQTTLDQLLPPAGELHRRIGRLVKDGA